ncbi:MAG: M48 family metallopeptidase [Candidatus Thorarchaeota archaeon]
MKNLDKYLDRIQEEKLTEIDPLIGTAVAGTAYLIGSLAFFLYSVREITRSLKVHKPLTERINMILSSGNHWVVHIYPHPMPNAFALGMGRHIFVTQGLIKMLSQRELEAVLLHEVHHNKNKDTYKHMAYKHSFFYLITFLALSTSSFSLPLGILSFIMMTKANNIAYALLIGRKMELKADKFSSKYGYGKDLISAFEKIDKEIERMYRKQSCGQWCQLERKVSDLIDEHPTTKKRVETILKKSDKLTKSNLVKLKDTIARIFKHNG